MDTIISHATVPRVQLCSVRAGIAGTGTRILLDLSAVLCMHVCNSMLRAGASSLTVLAAVSQYRYRYYSHICNPSYGCPII